MINPGDVVFTCNISGGMRKLIAFAQTLGSAFKGGTATAVHAAVVYQVDGAGSPWIAESVGHGLREKLLTPSPDRSYRVYRYTGSGSAELTRLAADFTQGCVAEAQRAPETFGMYAKGSAARSPFSFKARGNNGYRQSQEKSLFDNPTSAFFCSNFAFKVYATAAAEMGTSAVPILYGRSLIGPRDLMISFDSDPNWTHVGNY